MNSMSPYHSPVRCARCAKTEVAANWEVSSQKSKFSAWSYLVAPLGFSIRRRDKFTFAVPVCQACLAKLEQIRRTARDIEILDTILTLIVFGFFAILVWQQSDRHDLAMILVTFGLFGVFGYMVGSLLGRILALVYKDIMYYQFCGFDGRYFHLDQREYQQEFAALNPGFVKPKRKLF